MASIDEIKPLLESTNASDRIKALKQLVDSNGLGFPRKETAIFLERENYEIALELLRKCLDDKDFNVKTKAQEAITRLLIVNTRFAQPKLPRICVACGKSEPLSERFIQKINYDKGIVDKTTTKDRFPATTSEAKVAALSNPNRSYTVTYDYHKTSLNLQFHYCPECAVEAEIQNRLKIAGNFVGIASIIITFYIIWLWGSTIGINESAGLLVIIAGIVLAVVIFALLMLFVGWFLHLVANVKDYKEREKQVNKAVKIWLYPIDGQVNNNETAFLVDDQVAYSFGNDSFRDQFIELNRSLLLNQTADHTPKSA